MSRGRLLTTTPSRAPKKFKNINYETDTKNHILYLRSKVKSFIEHPLCVLNIINYNLFFSLEYLCMKLLQ